MGGLRLRAEPKLLFLLVAWAISVTCAILLQSIIPFLSFAFTLRSAWKCSVGEDHTWFQYLGCTPPKQGVTRFFPMLAFDDWQTYANWNPEQRSGARPGCVASELSGQPMNFLKPKRLINCLKSKQWSFQCRLLHKPAHQIATVDSHFHRVQIRNKIEF